MVLNNRQEKDIRRRSYRKSQRHFIQGLFGRAIGSLLRREFEDVYTIAANFRNHYHLRIRAMILYTAAKFFESFPQIRPAFWIPSWPVRLIAPRSGRMFLVCKSWKVRRRIRELVQESHAAVKPVGVFGAGRPTRWLLECTQLWKAPIKAILDDDPLKQGQRWCGYPIYGPHAILELGIGHVLISSPDHQEELYEKLKPLEVQGVAIIRLYPTENTRKTFAGDTGRTPREMSSLLSPAVGSRPLVVYLARRAEDLGPLARFIESYRAMHEPMAHDLLIIFKGFHRWNGKEAYRRHLDGLRYLEIELDDRGYDVGSYLEVYRRFRYPIYLFLGSFCVLHASNWLTKMVHCLSTHPTAGVVGCSGSWQTGIAESFPNYHIRTSAFMIRSEVLGRVRTGPIVTKRDAFLFEHGEHGLTQQILRMGLEPYVVGRNGRCYRKEEWPESATYHSHDQNNLLISDNRTDWYQDVDEFTREILSGWAWGKGRERPPAVKDHPAVPPPLCWYCGQPLRLRLKAKDFNRRLSDITFTYFACAWCNSLFLHPIPDNLDAYYPKGYYMVPSSNDALGRSIGPERYRINLLLPFKSSGKLLEIGPGNGVFTYLAQEAGFEVEAIESDTSCSEFLRDHQKVRVICTNRPDEAPLEKESYDVIALWHALEHLPHPLACLRAVSTWLRPQGVLLIAVPNPQSLQFRLLGKWWPHLDAPRHLCFFTLETLAAILAREGLHLAMCTSRDAGGRYWNRFGWERALSNLARSEGHKRCLAWVGTVVSRLIGSIEVLGLHGSTYTSIFRKSQRP